MPLYNSANGLLWDKVVEFRNSHSDKWFIPTVNELKELFKSVKLFNNLSVVTYTGYWTTTEYDKQIAKNVYLNNGQDSTITKNTMYERARMFRYATLDLLTTKTVEISSSTVSSIIRYNLNNISPTEQSTQYLAPFEIQGISYISARAYKDDYLPSDFVTYGVEEGSIIETSPFEYSDDNYNYSANKTRESK